jgi:hypothetical protein
MTFTPVNKDTLPCTRQELIVAGNLRDFSNEEPPRCIIIVGGGSVEMEDWDGNVVVANLPAGLDAFRPKSIGALTAVDIIARW